MFPLFVGREKSIVALDLAMKADKRILLVAQKQADVDDPKGEDLYRVGTVATILQLLKLPDGTVKVLVEGVDRASIEKLIEGEFFSAEVTALPDLERYEEREMDVLTRSVITQFEQYVKLNKKVPPEILTSLAGIEQAGRLADTVAAHMSLKLSEKQKVLEIPDVRKRLEHMLAVIEGEMDVLQIEKRIRGRVKQQMEKSQREYYLNEQMKAIQKELGELDDAPNEIGELEKRIKAAGMPKEAREKANSELAKLKLMSPMSAEATVVRNYVDWLVKAPWKKRSKVHLEIAAAEKVLEADHFGLDKVKERIVEYLAVQQRVKNLRGPILCLVGPPGVGKTSLGKSIARALGRKFARISMGGMHDEAEIRGHRRTYIGALPGQVIQALRRAGANDPVFMLDEVDKLGRDFRGDPASALLEVLDPEQNSTFRDNYLDVPFDLSKVLFITTANVLDPVPDALRDRMEIISLEGYTEQEKVIIAFRYLIPRQITENGLDTDGGIQFSDEAVRFLIRRYTREAGVRSLERELGSICRKQARRIAEGRHEKNEKFEVTPQTIEQDRGAPRFRTDTEVAERTRRPGVAVGLAWTPVGGDVLFIEAGRMPGGSKGLIMTGQLGPVMQESVQAALTWVRGAATQYGIDPELFKSIDIHIHVPAGAIPKDGPSAGITMASALMSMLTERRIRPNLAMTGEITLTGQVLPVGGIKEKVLAARRSGVREVIMPAENEVNVREDLKTEHIADMTIHYVNSMEEVIELALENSPATRE